MRREGVRRQLFFRSAAIPSARLGQCLICFSSAFSRANSIRSALRGESRSERIARMIGSSRSLVLLPESALVRKSRGDFWLSELPPEPSPRPSLPTTKRSATISTVPARVTYPDSDTTAWGYFPGQMKPEQPGINGVQYSRKTGYLYYYYTNPIKEVVEGAAPRAAPKPPSASISA
jgi:hypothetical protein